MLIGCVSELTGATRRAIRHYEAIGLIPEPQRSGTYRIYEDHDVLVIRMIRQAQALGFSLDELKDIVAKKSYEKKLPMDLACALIDTKIDTLEQEAAERLLKADELRKFRIDVVKQFT